MPVVKTLFMDPGFCRVWHFPSLGPRPLSGCRAKVKMIWWLRISATTLSCHQTISGPRIGLAAWTTAQLDSMWAVNHRNVGTKADYRWLWATCDRSGFKAWGNDGFPDLPSRTSTRVMVGRADRGMVEIPCGCWQLCVEKHKLVCKTRECLVHERSSMRRLCPNASVKLEPESEGRFFY